MSLPAEIWTEIFKHLRRPSPLPHTTHPRPERSSIRQTDLCSCLTVNKQFYNNAAPHLYRGPVISDAPSLLLMGVFDAPVPGTTPKVALLCLVERLFLEYADPNGEKPPRRDEYTQRIEWMVLFGRMTVKEIAALAKRRRLGDLSERCEGWTQRMEEYGQVDRIFTNLRTLSVGAILPLETEKRPGNRYLDKWKDPLFTVEDGLTSMVSRVNSIVHYCELSCGPLALAGRNPSAGTNRPTRIIHTHSPYPISFLPVPGGGPRYYMHFRLEEPDGDRQERIMGGVSHGVYRAMQHRARVGDGNVGRVRDLGWSLYANMAPDDQLEPPVSDEEKEKWRATARYVVGRLANELGESPVRKVFPGGQEAFHRWEINQIFDAPPCEACGWSAS